MDLDLGVGARPIDHDLRRPERVAPVEQVDLRREAGQVGRLLERGVATADHGDLAIAEEEPVARRARGHAAAPQARLAVEPEPQRRGPGGDDDGLRPVLGAACPQPEWPAAEIDPVDVDVDHPRTHAFGLAAHRGHQVRALDGVHEPRVVLDVAGQHQLAAGRRTGQDDRFEVGPRGIDRGGQSRRPRADDDDLGVDPALGAPDRRRPAGRGGPLRIRVNDRDAEPAERVRRPAAVGAVCHDVNRTTIAILPWGIIKGRGGAAAPPVRTGPGAPVRGLP